MTMTRDAGVIGAAAAVALIVTIVSTRKAHVEEQSTTDVDKLEALQDQVDALERSASVSRARAERSTQQPEPDELPAPVDEEEEVAPAPTVEERPPQPPAALDTNQMVGRLQERFSEQPSDPSWSRGATDLARTQVSSHLAAGSRMGAMECRESLCRVEIAHPDIDTYRTFMHDAFMQPSGKWEGPSMSALLGDPSTGPVTSVAYFVRPGVDVAMLMADPE